MFGKKTKLLESHIFLLGSIVLLPALLGGCAATQKQLLQDNVKQLERQLAQLKSERANLDAHQSALDDRMIVYEKKLKRCERKLHKNLSVVHVIPSEEDKEQAGSDPFETFQEETLIQKNQKRPMLTLYGRRPQAIGVGNGPLQPPSPGGHHGFDGLNPENLGVAPMDKAAKDSAMEVFQAAYRAYSNKKYDEALTGFSEFVRDNPTHQYADNAIFWRGECYLAKAKFFKAIGEFERMHRRFPKSEKLSSGLLRTGFAYDQLGDRGKALEYYFRVVDNHPGSDAARRASIRVAALKGGQEPTSKLIPTSTKR